MENATQMTSNAFSNPVTAEITEDSVPQTENSIQEIVPVSGPARCTEKLQQEQVQEPEASIERKKADLKSIKVVTVNTQDGPNDAGPSISSPALRRRVSVAQAVQASGQVLSAMRLLRQSIRRRQVNSLRSPVWFNWSDEEASKGAHKGFNDSQTKPEAKPQERRSEDAKEDAQQYPVSSYASGISDVVTVPELPRVVTHALSEAECAVEFIVHLAQAEFLVGEPMHRLQHNVEAVARFLAVDCTLISFPTYLLLTFGDQEKKKHHSLLHQNIHVFTDDRTQTWDVQKLFLVDHLVDRLVTGVIDLPEAIVDLDNIINLAPLYPFWVKWLAQAVSAMGCALLYFSGTWRDAGLAFSLGLLVGVLISVLERLPSFGRIGPAAIASIVSFLGAFLSSYGVVFASVIWLLPGLMFFTAVLELSTKNTVSGTARFFEGFITALQIGFGIAIGIQIAKFSPALTLTDCIHLDPTLFWWFPFVFILLILSWNILANAHYTQWFFDVIISAVGYFVFWASSKFDSEGNLAIALSAFSVAVTANAYARLTRTPSAALIMTGILLLVPGGLGLKTVQALMKGDSLSGLVFAFQMIVIAVSITVGVTVANVVVFPFKSHLIL